MKPLLPTAAIVSAALVASLVGAGSAGAQATFTACYVPDVGAIYLIQRTGLPTACLAAEHQQISWNEGGGGWSLAGNAGTTPGTDFLGTTDAAALEIHVGGARALRFEPAATSPNLVGGHAANTAAAGVHGAAVGGGGEAASGANRVTDAFGTVAGGAANVAGNDAGGALDAAWATVAGGHANVASGAYATVAGGRNNVASGAHSFAAMRDAVASGSGSVAIGVRATASNGGASAIGSDATASGQDGMALGKAVTASGQEATAMGRSTVASGRVATAMGNGTEASGGYSTSMGSATRATGPITTAMGYNTVAQAYASVAIGRFNVAEGATDAWNGNDPLLVAGNGTTDLDRANALELEKDGDLIIAGTLTESSDARLKTDVQPLGPALEGLRTLHPVRYRFLADAGHPDSPQIGLIAQEVEAVFPELVARDARGYLSLAYPKLTAVLVRAVQEQHALIDAQRERLDRLERELAELRERIGKP